MSADWSTVRPTSADARAFVAEIYDSEGVGIVAAAVADTRTLAIDAAFEAAKIDARLADFRFSGEVQFMRLADVRSLAVADADVEEELEMLAFDWLNAHDTVFGKTTRGNRDVCAAAITQDDVVRLLRRTLTRVNAKAAL